MTLNKLSPSQRKRGHWLCQLSDGSLVKVSESDVAALGLYSGMELDDAGLTALKQAAERSKTRDTALNLLAARPLSRRELERKLEQRSAPEEEISSAADWLEDLGLLNDEEYARQVARHYSAKGYGVKKLKDELYRRGVPREYWEAALEEQADPAEAIDAFLAKKLGDDPHPDQKIIQSVSNALARRGFSWSEIKDGLRRRRVDILED